MFEETTENTFETEEFDFNSMAQDYMEFARKYHEQYLIKGKKSDLDNAVDNYIDAIKFNPNIAEAYYRLATLLWDKGEINLSSAIEQCKSAINLSPSNPNAHIYAAYFLEMAKDYEGAEKELKKAIKLNPIKAARSRLSLASMYLDKMQQTNVNARDMSQSLYYMLSGGLSIALDYPSVRMIYKNLSKTVSLMFYDVVGKFLEKTKNYSMAVKAYDIAANSTGMNEVYYQKIGDINVQIILEKMGGGGHITLAGAQLEGLTLEEARDELVIRINEYLYEIQ
jgi:tetratricopeptide (TPR) repeat protein